MYDLTSQVRIRFFLLKKSSQPFGHLDPPLPLVRGRQERPLLPPLGPGPAPTLMNRSGGAVVRLLEQRGWKLAPTRPLFDPDHGPRGASVSMVLPGAQSPTSFPIFSLFLFDMYCWSEQRYAAAWGHGCGRWRSRATFPVVGAMEEEKIHNMLFTQNKHILNKMQNLKLEMGLQIKQHLRHAIPSKVVRFQSEKKREARCSPLIFVFNPYCFFIWTERESGVTNKTPEFIYLFFPPQQPFD